MVAKIKKMGLTVIATSLCMSAFCGICEASTYNISMQDSSWTFDIISIPRPAWVTDGPEWFTIIDRNLWATTNDITDTWSYWYHYQWWYNYGFDPSLSADAIKTTSFAEYDYAYQHNGYDGFTLKKFILGTSDSQFDIWADWIHNSLWWWEHDKESNNYGLDNISVTVTNRQWPCPLHYHVPSAWEWNKLLEYWVADYNAKWWNVSLSTNSNGKYFMANPEANQAFRDSLKLPLAGYRNYSSATVKNQGSYGNYWSSSPSLSSSNQAHDMAFSTFNVYSKASHNRAYGYSVRCFSNSYVAPEIHQPTSENQWETSVSTWYIMNN